MHVLEQYLFTFYHQGGGDIVIITTPAGEYITADVVDESSPDDWRELLTGENSSK